MSKFKVGDLAWSPIDGFHIIIDGRLRNSDEYPLRHGRHHYRLDGKRFDKDKYPSLLTVEEAAKLGYYPPKKKVKKTLHGWVSIYKDVAHKTIWESKEIADAYADESRLACIEVNIEYEVEE
jgi:hypothetical protein